MQSTACCSKPTIMACFYGFVPISCTQNWFEPRRTRGLKICKGFYAIDLIAIEVSRPGASALKHFE